MNLGVVILGQIVYIANIEQASLAFLTTASFFAHAEYNLIEFKLYNN